MDKNGFVKHISNSRGTYKAGPGVGTDNSSKEDGFEMYGSVVTSGGKRRALGDEGSEESILVLQGDTGILKTTQVSVERAKYGVTVKHIEDADRA